jgi:hypothetical protein
MTARAELVTGRGEQRATPITPVALIFIVLALSAYGTELVTGVFRAAAVPSGEAAVGDSIRTTFGTVTVETVQTIDGLTSADMWNGMTHGIQSLVQPDEAQVTVALSLANDGDRAVPVDAGQFRLVVEGRGDAVVPTGTTLLPLRLEPGSGVRGTLAFVVALNGVVASGALASLVYLDPKGPPITVPLGRLDQQPARSPGHADDSDHDE